MPFIFMWMASSPHKKSNNNSINKNIRTMKIFGNFYLDEEMVKYKSCENACKHIDPILNKQPHVLEYCVCLMKQKHLKAQSHPTGRKVRERGRQCLGTPMLYLRHTDGSGG